MKQLGEVEKQLDTLLGLSERTPQIIDIEPKLPTGTSQSVAIMVGSDWHSEENVVPDDVGAATRSILTNALTGRSASSREGTGCQSITTGTHG